jgi:predicted enzyme related to lactoylglutathione lyase
VTGRAISQDPGFLLYVWVDHIDESLARIESHGGAIVKAPQQISPGGAWIALFRDCASNVMGLYQEGPR